ncbi:MAG: hypothetical protein OEX81_04190 [Candidatus Pacebacteria bacterium]|nr:hypothetical protein [Candidatus Paceibacterota bacterium]
MAKELPDSLLKQRVIDISEGFPVNNGDEYLKLAWSLFKAGVYRIPIIGVKIGSNVTTLMLISNVVQEHAQLGKEIDLDPKKIVYTASLEGYPFNDRDPFFFYLTILSSKDNAYQRVGTGSDYYAPALTGQGIELLSKIFTKVGLFENY